MDKIVTDSDKSVDLREELSKVPVTTTTIVSGSAHFDARRTKTLVRKLDWHLLPFLSLLYLLSFLDRSNIGNARLFDLQKDLHMDTKYPGSLTFNHALMIFFPFYIAAEVPSNMMLKRFRPSRWLTIIMIAWSICTICMGLVHNLGGPLAVRAALGVAEGGLFPGVTYYITMWYRRHECALRISLFFSAATCAGAFGGLLAFAIGKMQGVAGRGGWSWIFIIEGLATFAVACVAPWMVTDSPRSAKFLSGEEVIEIERRLRDDHLELADEFDLKYVKDAFKDWKIYVQMLISVCHGTAAYSFALFLPTLIKNMGYTKEHSQLMTIPPYAVGCICTCTVGWLADKKQQRGISMMCLICCAIIGYIMLSSTDDHSVQYAGTFFVTCGLFSLIPLNVAWNGNNIGGSLKRGVGIAMQTGFANLGGVFAAYTYLSKDAPRFIPGHVALIVLLATAFCLVTFMRWFLIRENARRDKWAVDNNMLPENYTVEQRFAEREKGDNASFFRYTL